MSDWIDLRKRIVGRWQLPLLALSVILLVLSVVRLRRDPASMPLRKAAAYLDTLIDAGLFDVALEAGAPLLVRDGDGEPQRAVIRLRIARALMGDARQRRIRSNAIGRRVVEQYTMATDSGESLTPGDYLALGQAYEWQGRYGDALAPFAEAVRLGVDGADDLRKRIITLKQSKLGTSQAELDGDLDVFLSAIRPHRLDLRYWALERKVETLESLGRLDQANTLLARNRDDFVHSDFRDHFEFLESLLLYKTGYTDEAELRLRTLRNRVDPSTEVHAMSGWLLGRVVMRDATGPKRPQEALSFFRDVIGTHAEGPFAVASRMGMGEAFAMMERHDEAVEAFELAFIQARDLDDRRYANAEVMRVALSVLANTLRREGQLGAAVRYARLASQLVGETDLETATLILRQYAELQALRAEELRSQPVTDAARGMEIEAEARSFDAGAATTYLELARLSALNERRASKASWRAAELFALAGSTDRAAELFERFARDLPLDPLVPRALLRVGQLNQQAGHLSQAVAAYRECFRRFPRTLDAARALVPLAECYLTMGTANHELAEKTLRIVLEESEMFTPDAPEYADALILLGKAQLWRGAFEPAIATFEEVLQRYPHPRNTRTGEVRFLLADAFRRSGLALKEEARQAETAREIEHLRAQAGDRLADARAGFRGVVVAYGDRDPVSLDAAEAVYLRHAYLYEADCYFETHDYLQALKLYEEAAGLFKDRRESLAAYVQIINSNVFLGRPVDARSSLARALVLVESLPDAAFEGPVALENRDDWRRYLRWLGESSLF